MVAVFVDDGNTGIDANSGHDDIQITILLAYISGIMLPQPPVVYGCDLPVIPQAQACKWLIKYLMALYSLQKNSNVYSLN